MTKPVTLADIYQVVNRLEDKMDKRLSDDERRIDILEDSNSRTLGIFSVVSVIGTAFFSWFWEKINKTL